MTKFKRFMVWRSEEYYPGGGLNDFEESFDTLEEAENFIKERKSARIYSNDWFGIFDRIEGVELEPKEPKG